MENSEVPYGFVKDGKLFRSKWSDYPEKEIGEVRDNDIPKSVEFFVNRFNDLQQKIDEVTQKIEESDNKGSFLMKLLHLKELLPKYDGLGDYPLLFDRIEKYESLIKDIITKNRSRNSDIKKALLIEAKEAAEAINWKEGTTLINDIKSRWLKTGNAEEDLNESLEKDFWEIVEGFFQRKKGFYEDKQKLLDYRKNQYEELVSEASKVNELTGKVRFDKVKELRASWKSIGGVPNEIFQPLVEQFNSHLKQKPVNPSVDYSKILDSLNEIKKGKSYKKSEIEDLKKTIKGDRRRSDKKTKALELIQLITERDFVNKLTQKRFNDFNNLTPDKKKNIRIAIIKDLISRDQQELKMYEENSANFSSSDGNFDKLVENKLKGQRKKITIKQKLLEWIDRGEF